MRDSKGRYVEGHKSQGGRPSGSKGIAAYIKENTDNLQELVDMSLEMLRKNDTIVKDKISLLNMLMDRAIGKPQQFIDATVRTELDDMLNQLEEYETDGAIANTLEKMEE